MTEKILLAVLGFGLGILATFISQWVLRNFGFDNAKRKKILEHISTLRERLDDYEKLFNCDYPKLSEFAYAQDVLHPKNPYYSEESSRKLYKALVQYKAIRKSMDGKERLIDEALSILKINKVIRPERYKPKPSFNYSIYRDALYENSNSVLGKLEILRTCDSIYFHDFPKKVANFIDWDKLDEIKPEDVRSIFIFRLQSQFYYDGSSAKANDFSERENEKREELRDFWDNLHHYRTRAFQLIAEIGIELSKLEQTWRVPI